MFCSTSAEIPVAESPPAVLFVRGAVKTAPNGIVQVTKLELLVWALRENVPEMISAIRAVRKPTLRLTIRCNTGVVEANVSLDVAEDRS